MAFSDAVQESLAVAVGAAVGANARYWIGVWFKSMHQGHFPWSTFVINVSGSLLIGILSAAFTHRPVLIGWQLFAIVGLLGGYTTFSSFSLDILGLLREGHVWSALGYSLGSLMLGLACCAVGYFGVNRMLGPIG